MSSIISVGLRRAAGTAPTHWPRLFNNPATVVPCASFIPSVSRSFNTNTQVTNYGDSDRRIDVDRRSDRCVSRNRDPFPNFFSDVLDPFSAPRNLSQMLNLVDQFMENPLVAVSRDVGAGSRRGWDVREDNDALFLRMDMPGLGKDDVKLAVDHGTLIVKGEEGKESKVEEDAGRRYSTRLDIPPNLYKLDSIRAEMKNGVLKIMIPKVKEEQRKDVRHVKID